MAIFNSKLLNYQMVYPSSRHTHSTIIHRNGDSMTFSRKNRQEMTGSVPMDHGLNKKCHMGSNLGISCFFENIPTLEFSGYTV